MNKRIVLIGGIVAAVGIIGGAGWYIWNQTGESSDEMKVYVSTVASLTGGVGGEQNRYAGVVEPQKTVNVKAESDRKVKTLYVKEGDVVQQGSLLFEYDASTAQDNLAQAELELERLKNEAVSLSEQIETLTKEKQDAKEDDQLSYTIEIQTVQMDRKKNEYDQRSKEKEIEKLKNASQNLQVKSEISGVIKSIDESVMSGDSGELDSSQESGGDSSKFITIVATGTYRVKGLINETNMASITQGDPVIIRSRVDDTVTWTGVMTGVDTKEPEEKETGAMDWGMDSGSEETTSSKYPFYVELDSADGLMLGQHVYIEPDKGQTLQKDGLWLDENFILDADTKPYVWASTPKDKLEKREVSLGDYDQVMGQYQILDGLTENDCIAFPDDSYEEGMVTTTNEQFANPGGGTLDSSFDSSVPDSSFDSSIPDSSFESEDSSTLDSGFGSGIQILEEGVAP